MKLSDFVFDFLTNKGTDTVFYLPGGGCMHLLNSLGQNKNINAVSLLHEQAVAIAAESYANTSGKVGVALVTTGPGSTNTVTGVLSAYLDSIPCLFISGQVKTADFANRYGVRSLGSQEADIVSIVKPITKYAVTIKEKSKIFQELETAWQIATTGRKGPVWLDIPLDVQGADIEPSNEPINISKEQQTISEKELEIIVNELSKAEKPVIIAGNGIHLADCKKEFYDLLYFLQIPVIPTWKAIDLIANDNPFYAGRAGGMGDRHGNLTMQNSDLLLCLGTRLDFSITGYDKSKWAEKAKKIIVDIDKTEIDKQENAKNIIPIIANVSTVINKLLERKNEIKTKNLQNWKKQIEKWKNKFPIAPPNTDFTIYNFVLALSELLPKNALIAPCSSGTTVEIFFQAFKVKQGQKIRNSHGFGSMGFELPNAIGMCIAENCQKTICIAGDGSIQLNIQELSVIKARNLPIIIFAINNNGYASIRNMQNTHFKGLHLSCDSASGLYLPELKKISSAYGLNYFCIENIDDLNNLPQILEQNEPTICEVFVSENSIVTPRTATMIMPDGSLQSSPLENQFPFLREEEF